MSHGFTSFYQTFARYVSIVDRKIRVLTMTYGQALAEGVLIGHEKWRVTGYRDALGTTESHLAVGAVGRFAWPAVAQTWYISSSSANDDGSPAGTGARTLTTSWIDAAENQVDEVITLNGTAQVATVGTYLAPYIDDTHVETAGVLGRNAGTITCHSATPGTTATIGWTMSAGVSQARGSVYMVPAGKTAYFIKVRPGESTTKGVTFRMYTQEPGKVWRGKEVWTTYHPDIFEIPPSWPAGTRVEFTGVASGSGTICSFKALGWIET